MRRLPAVARPAAPAAAAPAHPADQAAPAYNLFRRKRMPELCCAVPEDRPVPAFVDGEGWDYAGLLSRPGPSLPGFDSAAAELGVRLNGFHLFQVAGRMVRADPGARGTAGNPTDRQLAGR